MGHWADAVSDDLTQLEDWAGALLAQLEPNARRRLARALAIDLRRSQQQRIAAQQKPDGSAYAPRKPRKGLRQKKGRIKRAAMFVKLRQSKHLKASGDASQAVVQFLGRAARIARVHQEGATDQAIPSGPRVRYPRRELLGFTASDRERIRELLLDHLAT